MPLYEYRCPACNCRFEVLQRIGEAADGLACPGCGRPGPEKEFSTFASGGGPTNAACGSGRFT